MRSSPSRYHVKMMMKVRCVVSSAIFLLAFAFALPAQQAAHVVVFGVDGLSPRGVEEAQTPAMHSLMERGAWTMHARSVIPTVSAPNWSAMIMGAAPDLTGVISNEWRPKANDISSACRSHQGIFPTIFWQIRQFQPVAKVGYFTDWDGFAVLVEPSTADPAFAKDQKAREVVDRALRFLREEKPLLTFIHVDIVDHAGHEKGWYTREYKKAAEETDALLGEVLKTIDSTGLGSSTIVLLTADHGGHGKKHGDMVQTDIEIPWVAAGPGIPHNQEIPDPVSITQTAPTIAAWLGIAPNACWLAIAVPLATAAKLDATERKR